MPVDPTVNDAARAILDGTPPDWTSLESSTDLNTQDLIDQLRVLSAIATLHRSDGPSGIEPLSQATASDIIGRWAHLNLLEHVGSGAFGEVYRAWDTRLDREVALKLLRIESAPGQGASPVIHEGRLLARVRHPNVATIYGAELIDGQIGLWMEFVRGRTLESLLQIRRCDVSEVIQIGLELCRALAAVHAAGVLHRDIKAQNVMRADDGRVVLMDFGTGREDSSTGAGLAGTPLCLAPELFRGEPATIRSDVYSVGVLLYRLLTAAYPAQARTVEELRSAHERRERVNLRSIRPDIPLAVTRIIERAIEPDPERRYPTCEAMAADLQSVAASRHSRWPIATLVAVSAGVIAWLVLDTPRSSWIRRPAALTRAGVGGAAGLDGRIATAARSMAIAVLPFRNLSSAPESDLIVDGLTYELIRSLAIIDGLEVRSATSSFAVKGQPLDLKQIGRKLGVNLIIEGSVFYADGQWRVQAQLANVAGDTPLWTGKFDRDGSRLFAIQDEISLAVVNQLRLTLGRGQRRYNLDAETQAMYLKARTLVERRGSANAQAAVGLFEQIIARDRDFAPAYAGLADAYAFFSQDLPDVGGMDPARALVLMRAAAQQALAFDPLLAEAHAAMGIVHARACEWREATREFRRAIELNPGLTITYTNYNLTTLMPLGQFEEAERLLNEALRRDPLSLSVQRELAVQQVMAGRYEEAIQSLDRVRAVDPNYPIVDLLLARARALSGRISESMPYWESVSAQVGSQHWMAYAYVRAGRRGEIEQLAAQPQHPYRQVLFFTALGDTDRALDALEEASLLVPDRVVRLLGYPELASLRRQPRFEAVRSKFGLPRL